MPEESGNPMTSTAPAAAPEGLSRRLALAFAPLHKRAFGVAMGTAVGTAVAALTLIAVLRGEGEGLVLLAQYFRGYRVSVTGALIGWGWGFLIGFVGGWFLAFCRNFVVAVSLFLIRTRAELAQTRDFLDHI